MKNYFSLPLSIAYFNCFALLGGCSGTLSSDVSTDSRDVDASALAVSGPITRLTQPNKCIDVRGASSVNGTVVQIYDCNKTAAQAWPLNGNSLQVLG